MASKPQQSLIAASIVAVIAGMVGLSYAAVPLYRMFCAATGYNGTTQVATSAPQHAGIRPLNVRFDSNVAAGLNWSFEPELPSVNIRAGQTVTAYYHVTSHARTATTGIARYNVAPDAAGAWFNKISCFCFSEVTLNPGETMDLPVVFFLDPGLENDDTMKNVAELTLSYTFYGSSAPVASKAALDKKL